MNQTLQRSPAHYGMIALLVSGDVLGTVHVALAQEVPNLPERVAFVSGMTSVTLNGVCGGTYPPRDYALHARGGSRMRVRLSGSDDQAVEVFAPDARLRTAHPWSMGTASPGQTWNAELLNSGEYLLRISGCSQQPERYMLEITVENIVGSPFPTLPRSGRYERDDGASLELDSGRGGTLRFHLEARWNIPGYAEHIGDASGTLRLRGHTATWRRGSCSLVFRMTSQRVYVQQFGSYLECEFGTNVSADGVYSETQPGQRVEQAPRSDGDAAAEQTPARQ